jgi:hypothetical protein
MFASLILAAAASAAILEGQAHVAMPLRGQANFDPAPAAGGPGQKGIFYKMGNPLLTSNINVYLVWYGTWTADQKSIVNTFLDGLCNTSWWGVERQVSQSQSR